MVAQVVARVRVRVEQQARDREERKRGNSGIKYQPSDGKTKTKSRWQKRAASYLLVRDLAFLQNNKQQTTNANDNNHNYTHSCSQ